MNGGCAPFVSEVRRSMRVGWAQVGGTCAVLPFVAGADAQASWRYDEQ
jgi:hypothetical protein